MAWLFCAYFIAGAGVWPNTPAALANATRVIAESACLRVGEIAADTALCLPAIGSFFLGSPSVPTIQPRAHKLGKLKGPLGKLRKLSRAGWVSRTQGAVDLLLVSA